MKKKLLAVLAIVLVIAMSVAGTYAYLTAKTAEVKNTFTAVSDIIDDPDDPDDPTNKEGFDLVENNVVLKDGKYELGNDTVTSNTYDKVVPGMVIPKNPTLYVNITEGVSAYVFVEVVDNNSMMSYALTGDWTKLEGVTGAKGGDVYVYQNAVINGVEGQELNDVQILVGNQVTAAADVEGLNGGTITFYSYACQANGFDSAAAAYTACFPAVPQGE